MKIKEREGEKMNFYNLMTIFKVFFGYTVLVFGFSAFFLQPILKGKRFSVCFLVCFLSGNFYFMNIVFILLLFFHCTNRILTILVFIFTAIVLRLFLEHKKMKGRIRDYFQKFQHLITGTYGWRLFFREIKETFLSKLKLGSSFLFVNHQMDILGILLCLSIQAVYIGYRLIIYSGYGGYDEIVHAKWIQSMMDGQIYSSGVYPFGFHEMVYSIAKIFHLLVPQVVRYFGFVIMIYMTLMLYCLIADTLQNRIAAFIATFVYSGVNIYIQEAWDRCGFGYPQEFGAVFLYPMMIFFFLYLKEKKKFYLLFFGIGFSLTLYVHYYVTIIAVLFCFSAGIFYFIYMIRKKLLLPLLLCGLIVSMAGTMTMVLGVVTGHPLQDSLYWALNVISGEELIEEQETIGAEKEDTIEKSEEEISENKKEEKNRIQRLLKSIHKARLANCMTENSFRMFSIFTIVSFLIAVSCFFPGQDLQKGLFIITFIGYLFLLDILMAAQELGLPILMEEYRVRVFLCYALPYMLAVPVYFVVEWLQKFYGNAAKEQAILQRVSMLPIIVFAVVTLTRYELYRYPGRTTVIQSDAVIDGLYQIIKEYDDFTWTLVSDVQEYAMCMQNGQHYEWITFLEKLSSGVTDIKIPTKYIFFAIEKKPIAYGTIIENGTKPPVLGTVSEYYAKQEISYKSDMAYIEQRLQIMSKAYYWAKAYAEKFPEEMQIYYEDENVIYYRLTQETYYLNNLKIDYGYNSIDANINTNISTDTNTNSNREKDRKEDTANIDRIEKVENAQ